MRHIVSTTCTRVQMGLMLPLIFTHLFSSIVKQAIFLTLITLESAPGTSQYLAKCQWVKFLAQ